MMKWSCVYHRYIGTTFLCIIICSLDDILCILMMYSCVFIDQYTGHSFSLFNASTVDVTDVTCGNF